MWSCHPRSRCQYPIVNSCLQWLRIWVKRQHGVCEIIATVVSTLRVLTACIEIAQHSLALSQNCKTRQSAWFFFIRGVVHRNSILIRSNKMQQHANIYLLQNYSTCFGCPSHPSSGVNKILNAAYGTDHITYPGDNLPPAWPN